MNSKFKFNFVLSALLVIFGLTMLYTGLHAKTPRMNSNTALGIVLVVYGVTRYFLYSRFGRPNE